MNVHGIIISHFMNKTRSENYTPSWLSHANTCIILISVLILTVHLVHQHERFRLTFMLSSGFLVFFQIGDVESREHGPR